MTGDGTGALANPEPINLGLQQYLGSDTLDMLALMRRPDGNPVPLLVFQHAVGSFGRELCLSYEFDPGAIVCNHVTPVQGPLAVGDLNGTAAGVPPDEIVTSEGGGQMGIFGFSRPPLAWGDSPRTVPGDPAGSPGLESATLGDLDSDGDLDVLAGQFVNSVSARVASIHYFLWGATGLEQVARPLPSIPGLDAVAVADVDGDGCNDVVGAGDYGRGMIHLGDCAGDFDGGQDLPQLGYQNPATATRVTLAVGDLSCDGRPELVITDTISHYVMVYRNTSAPSGVCAADHRRRHRHRRHRRRRRPSAAGPSHLRPAGHRALHRRHSGDDVLVGSARRDVLSGRGGKDCVFGRGGDDRLSGGSGSDVLSGSSGDDRLNGDAGDDRINGGNGNDMISPGTGKDKVAANGGDDTISARDQTRDTIDCGAGRDKVTADRTDTVKNCEFVKRPKRAKRTK